MISNVTGSFNIFRRNAETDGDDFTTCSVRFSADISLMYTVNEQDDGQVMAANFLMPKNPDIFSFSTKQVSNDEDSFDLCVSLTIKSVTKNIKLSVEKGGVAKNIFAQT